VLDAQRASRYDLKLRVFKIWAEKGVLKLVILILIDWFFDAVVVIDENTRFKVSDCKIEQEPTTTPSVKELQLGGFDT